MTSRSAPSPSAEPRGGARHKVFLPARMTGPEGENRVHLLNLSRTGALVHGETTPPSGTVVQLSCAGTSWLARVVWVRDKRFGVVHVIPFTDDAVEALVRRAGG